MTVEHDSTSSPEEVDVEEMDKSEYLTKWLSDLPPVRAAVLAADERFGPITKKPKVEHDATKTRIKSAPAVAQRSNSNARPARLPKYVVGVPGTVTPPQLHTIVEHPPPSATTPAAMMNRIALERTILLAKMNLESRKLGTEAIAKQREQERENEKKDDGMAEIMASVENMYHRDDAGFQRPSFEIQPTEMQLGVPAG